MEEYRGFLITAVCGRDRNKTYYVASVSSNGFGPYVSRDLKFKAEPGLESRTAWRSKTKLKAAIDKVCSMLELD